MQHSERFVALVNTVKSQVKQCTVSDVHAWQSTSEPFILVDVREESEWQKGHLPDALYLGKGIIERDIEKIIPDQNAKIVLYCGGGSRSSLAAYNLQQMGYQNVYSMDGGVRGWQAAHFPIVQA